MNRWSLVYEFIRYLNLLEISHKREITHQQILAMRLTYVEEKKYKTEIVILALGHFALFRNAYGRMREDFELPSITSLTRLTSKVKILVICVICKMFFPVRF